MKNENRFIFEEILERMRMMKKHSKYRTLFAGCGHNSPSCKACMSGYINAYLTQIISKL
jgi:hypothetical protein